MIDARDWVFACRAPEAWRAALAWKRERRLSGLRRLCSASPDAAAFALRYFLEHAAQNDAVLLHPAFHAWLSRASSGADGFAGFAASAALSAGGALSLDARLDAAGRFHLHGLGRYLDLGPGSANAAARLIAAPDRWLLRTRAGATLAVSTKALKSPRGAAGIGVLPLVAGRMEINALDPLILSVFAEGSSAYDHKVAPLSRAAAAAYMRVLREAVSNVGRFDGALCAELLTDIRVLVPLGNQRRLTSVSSTYSSMQGAIGLSHSPDAIVQGETLIHEFSHNKLNLLLEMTALFDPRSPTDSVFYSPWREDRRPLRGLLLGAHAFLNTARFGAWSLRSLEPEGERRRLLSLHVCKTLLRVECALRTLAAHGIFTPAGRRLVVAMTAALIELKKSAADFPAEILAESRMAFNAHREKHEGLDTRALERAP